MSCLLTAHYQYLSFSQRAILHFMRFASISLLPAAAGCFLAATRLLAAALVLPGGLPDPEPVVSQQNPVSGRASIIGKWLLCTTQRVTPYKKPSQLTRADTSFITANACTEVVFQAQGRGHAGIGTKQHAFTWRQQGDSLTIRYGRVADAARLQGGTYKMSVRALPSSFLTQLALSTTGRTTYFLMQ